MLELTALYRHLGWFIAGLAGRGGDRQFIVACERQLRRDRHRSIRGKHGTAISQADFVDAYKIAWRFADLKQPRWWRRVDCLP